MVIVLLGYMGSGKSTIGRQLAKDLNLKFYDLDSLIETEEKTSIPELFNSKGELYFRKLESQVLANTLADMNDVVLALGGGTPCYANNLELLQKEGLTSVYLKLTVTELVARLFKEKNNRPLIRDVEDEQMAEFIGKHLFERQLFYNQADVVIDCKNKSVKEVVEEIRKLL